MTAIATAPDQGIELVWQRVHLPTRDQAVSATARGGIGPSLAARYGGELSIPLHSDRPTIVANFVETIDGVVSMDAGKSGGGDVSGHSKQDRFVMGLLRSLADAVVIGAGVLRGTETGARTPAAAFPAAADDFAELRARLGLHPTPLTVVVTASGNLDPRHAAFSDPRARMVVAGPGTAIARLSRSLPGHVRLETLSGGDVSRELAALLRSLGARLAVSEAGPNLGSQLISAGVLDELFLTISPQLAGRDATSHRLGLVEGVALWPDSPRWAGLTSIRRAGDHLFLRYTFGEHGNEH